MIKNALETLHEQVVQLYSESTGARPENMEASTFEVVASLVGYYKNIIACMPDHVYWMNRDSRLMGGNNNLLKMFKKESIDQLIGLSYEEMVKLADWPEGEDAILLADDTKIIQTGEPIIAKPERPVMIDDKVRYYMTTKLPLYDTTKELIGIVGISTDITNLKMMELELIEAKERAEASTHAKSEFIQNMSHDLRTALTGLLSVAEVQADNLPNHHEHKEHFILMRDASRDLHHFCETVLEAAALEHNDKIDVPVPFSMEMLITQKVNLFKPAMIHKGLTFSVEPLSDNIPPLLGHPLMLERVLINLLGNAIKFTDVGGITLQYGLSEQPCDNGMTHQLTLIVSDTGQGIPEDKQAIIFDSFTRLTPSYQGLHKGQGLGLYITQKLLHQMGGTITVQSEGIGTGTTFCCQLPVLLSSTPIEEPVANSDKPYRILIADDSRMARFAAAMLIKDALKHATIEQAGTLSEIIEKTAHTAYDLLILDLAFPDGDAKTAVKHIRHTPDEKNVETPIVALTGRLDTTVYRDCLQAGMSAAISKPLTSQMLQGIVDNLLT